MPLEKQILKVCNINKYVLAFILSLSPFYIAILFPFVKKVFSLLGAFLATILMILIPM